MKKATHLSLLLAVATCAFLMSTVLGAGTAEAQKKNNVIRLSTGKNNKGFVIRGRIQKPQAFYILSRSSFNYNAVRRKGSLIKKVINAVKKQPF